jgi:sulfatase maturation enzyme AslB (radical SAM superfamily)
MQTITFHEYLKSFPKLEKELDGSSMCAMKWIHQYVNLETGVVKMCHNVPHRYITQQEVDVYGKNIFFNHPYEIARRTEKLNNIRHSECSNCWSNEDRGIRSCRLPQPFYDLHRSRFSGEVLESMPTQLEIAFSNLCDLKCIYCSANYSSQWETEELKYNTSYQVPQRAPEKFLEAFWAWLEDDAVTSLLQYYILGGEPLIQPQFYEFIEKLIPLLKNKTNKFNVKPELIIVTNGNAPEKYLDKWINILPQLSEVVSIQMNISIEGYGNRAEYIRTNLNWNRFSKNIDSIFFHSKNSNISLRFSITHSALSITSSLDLLKWIKQIKDKHNVNADLIRTNVSKPLYLAPWILTKDFKKYVDETCDWILNFAPEWDYYIDFLQSIANGFETHNEEDIKNFLMFNQKMKERRNLNAEEIFTEMTDWFNYCKHYE